MTQQEYFTAVWQHGAELEWTTLRSRRGVCEQVAREKRALDVPAATDETFGARRAAAIGAALSRLKGSWSLVLPSDRVLLRIVDLPSTDPEELAGMAELQVDKFAPFPVDQMTISFEVLAVGKESSRVCVAACRRDTVEDWAERFAAVGRPPDRIDVLLVCRWQALRADDRVPPKGRHALLFQDSVGVDLVVVQDGVPVVMRPLGPGPQPDDVELLQELAEEVGYTLTSLESERGGVATTSVTLFRATEIAIDLAKHLEKECGIPVQIEALDERLVPQETAAKRLAGNAMLVLNLALPAWRHAAAVRAGRQRWWTWVGGLAALWMLGVGMLYVAAAVEGARVETLRSTVAGLEGPAEEAGVLRRRIASLEQYADRTYSALEVLREVSALLPDGVELTSFTYRKGDRVNIRGEAGRVPPIYDFFEALEASLLFVEVSPEGVTQAPGGRRRPDFRLTARLPGDGS